VAICTPDLTLGHAGEQALKAAGVWDRLNAGGKLLRLDQPLKIKQEVIQRKADAALIYAAGKTCSVTHPERCLGDKADVVMTVSEKMHGGMVARAAVLTTTRNPELAQRFVQFMRTPEAQQAIAQMGYGKVEPTP
jgi:ABC-type molybdate transport system substrate-binding protein